MTFQTTTAGTDIYEDSFFVQTIWIGMLSQNSCIDTSKLS